jgi:predicted type IV restriction endonuclease
MKLRELLEETEEEISNIIKTIKERVPGAKDIKKERSRIIGGVNFTHTDGKKYNIIQLSTDKFLIRFRDTFDRTQKHYDNKYEIDQLMNTISREEAEKLTKEIRNKAVKLPKRKFKL